MGAAPLSAVMLSPVPAGRAFPNARARRVSLSGTCPTSQTAPEVRERTMPTVNVSASLGRNTAGVLDTVATYWPSRARRAATGT